MNDKKKPRRKQVTLAEAQEHARKIGHTPARVRILSHAHKVGTGPDEIVMNYPKGKVTIKPDRTTKDMFLIIEEGKT